MTKLREPGSIPHAITQVMAVLSPEGAGEAVGKSESMVRFWSDPDKPDLPTVEQAIKLDAAYQRETGTRGPVLKAAVRQLTDLAGNETPAGRCLFDHLAQLTDSLGTVAGEIRKGWADGKLTPGEIHEIEESLHTLVMAIDAARAEINEHRPKPRPINHPVSVAQGMAAE